MAPKVQVQPGFLLPGDDVMALVTEVGNSLKAILKNEQAVADLKKSEQVATSDAQTLKDGGKKGSGEHVVTADPQVGLGKGEFSASSAERSGAETSSSGGGHLPTKPSGMAKASPSASESSGDYRSPVSTGGMSKGEYSSSSSSASESSSPSPMAKASPSPEGSPPSPSASAGSPSASASVSGEGSPAGAPPAGDPAAPAGGEAPTAAMSFEELVQTYSQLSPEDLQAHMAAIEQAAQAQAGAAPGGPGAPPSPAPGPGPGAPPSPAPGPGPGPSAMPPSAGMPPMGKSEPDWMVELKKTQDQVAAVAEAVTAVLTLPKRKAINGLTIVPMQKSETEPAGIAPSFEELKKNPAALHSMLKKMTMPDSPLQKNERDLVNDFYCRRISVEELAPLFQVKK